MIASPSSLPTKREIAFICIHVFNIFNLILFIVYTGRGWEAGWLTAPLNTSKFKLSSSNCISGCEAGTRGGESYSYKYIISFNLFSFFPFFAPFFKFSFFALNLNIHFTSICMQIYIFLYVNYLNFIHNKKKRCRKGY